MRRARTLVLVAALCGCGGGAGAHEVGGSSGTGEVPRPEMPDGSTGFGAFGSSGPEEPAREEAGFDEEPEEEPEYECELLGSECPPGHKCTVWSDGGKGLNASKCVVIAPDPAGPGERCSVEKGLASGLDDCAMGSFCWAADPDSMQGRCFPLCGAASPCPRPDECIEIEAWEAGVCVAFCDPLAQDCPGGRSCVAADTHFVCVRDESGDGGAMGDPCESLAGCDPGLFCLAALAWPGCRGTACCAPACDLQDPDGCDAGPDGVECVAWYGPRSAPPSTDCTPFEQIGVCSLP